MPQVPRIPRHAIDRPELRARLDVGCMAPLTLLVAPAGSGKSVLLAQWADSRPSGTVAWVDVRRSDVDAVEFARRLTDAVGVPWSSVAAPVGTPGGGFGEPFVDAFAAALGDVGDITVVFDDLHHLARSPIVGELWRLVDRLPASAHFIFASRVDLKIGLSKHRLAHGMVELRQSELAFTDDVTAGVLERITGRAVSSPTAAAVNRHTEGWAAGVQLSALSLRFGADSEQLAGHLDATNRLIVDYLSEEVFDAQTPQRRRALLRMSVLDEVSAGLVQAVADVRDGDEFLKRLERESMFLEPVPDRPGRHRLHHLFRDLLRYRLRETDAGLERQLLVVAADWHLLRGDTATAVEYLIRAREWEAVCSIALASGSEVYERLKVTSVARWLSLVPDDVRRSRPDAELMYGIVVGMSGRGALATDILQRLLAQGSLDVGGRQAALAYLATCVYFQPHPDRYLVHAESALALLTEHPEAVPPDILNLTSRPLLTTVSHVALGRAHLLLGNLVEARAALETALTGEGSQYGAFRVQVLGTSALAEAWAGRLSRATELSDEALDLARDLALLGHPAPADAHLARAIVAIQRGEAESGATSLHEGSIRAAANQRTSLMWIAHVASALVDPHGSRSAAIQPFGVPPPAVARALRALEWRWARLQGEPLDPHARPESTWSTLAFEQVLALLERGSIADARALLSRIPYDVDDELPVAAIEHDLASALLASAEGRRTSSRKHLQDALARAEGEGLAYPLMSAGPKLHALAQSLGMPPSSVLQAVESPGSRPPASPPLTEGLTTSELEVLEYLPTRLTGAEIAARRYTSVNTVKTHLAHIYRKLDVTDRDSAITRGIELGLLPRERQTSPR